MNDPPPTTGRVTDDDLDAAIRGHLRAELDPHVGSATARLDALLAAECSRVPRRPRIGARWSAAAAVLIGLGVGISMVARELRSRPPTDPPVARTVARTITGVARPPADAIVTSWSETYDDGTVLVDPRTPARLLRRVEYEKTEWKDAAGQWRSSVASPREDVILVDLQKQ